MRVMVVDDKEEERYLAETLLKGNGYEVVTAVNGAEALEKLRAEGFDMIVSDVLMPVMDGFRLCRECRGDEKLKDIPFVFYTATYKDERDEDLAAKVGADKYIRKPLEPEEFIKVIQGLVQDIEEGKIGPKKLVLEEEKEVLKLYSERLIEKLEKKMLELEAEVTERKQAEEALQIAEQNFRNSLENSPLGIRIVTAKGELLYANQAILDICGCSSVEELKATPLRKRYAPESYAEYLERNEKRKLGKLDPDYYEISIVRKDGEIRYLLAFRKEVMWGGEVQFQTLYQDITEQKQAEEALRESEARYRTLYDTSTDAIMMLTPEEGFFGGNRATIVMFGCKDEGEFISQTLSSLSPEYQTDGAVSSVKAQEMMSMAVEKGSHFFEWKHKRMDGTEFFATVLLTRMELQGKKVLQATVRDITERKKAEESIKRAAEEWRTTFDSITDLVFITDKDYKLVRANKAFVDVVKMKPEELIGKPCYEIVHGTNKPWPDCPYKVTIRTKEPAIAEFLEPHLGMHLEVATSPIFNENGEVVASVHLIRDITGRKKMEEQLMVTDRLASIGELASGIAHELNNPLTSVIGFSELLLDRDVPDDIKEDLEVINREAKRTAEVVRNLLTFARKHAAEKEPVDIHNIIQKVLQLRAYEQKVSNIEVNTQFAADLPEITADGFQLQQVFINIIINAEHFMIEAHRRGTLTITTERLGDIIRASFTDDGPGIAKESLRYLFDPFFTTKEVGKGTGLGLSICHGIVTGHSGRIYAESELGKGATFIVELPINK